MNNAVETKEIRLIAAEIKVSRRTFKKYLDGYGFIEGREEPISFRTYGENEALRRIDELLKEHGPVSRDRPAVYQAAIKIVPDSPGHGEPRDSAMITNIAKPGEKMISKLGEISILAMIPKRKSNGEPANFVELRGMYRGRPILIEARDNVKSEFEQSVNDHGLEISAEKPILITASGEFVSRNFTPIQKDGDTGKTKLRQVWIFVMQSFELLPSPEPAFTPAGP
jgi:hypothetical protein